MLYKGDYDLTSAQRISSAPQRFILISRRKRVLLSILAQMQDNLTSYCYSQLKNEKTQSPGCSVARCRWEWG